MKAFKTKIGFTISVSREEIEELMNKHKVPLDQYDEAVEIIIDSLIIPSARSDNSLLEEIIETEIIFMNLNKK